MKTSDGSRSSKPIDPLDERRRSDAELQQQWRTFDAILSHTPDFNYTFDLDGRFTYVNRALLSLWNKSLSEAVGKNFHDLDYPPELAERLQRQIQEVVLRKETIRDATPYTGANGQSGHYEYIFVPVLGENGEVEAIAGSTRDISEHVRMTAALAASEARLQQVFSQAPVAIVVFRGRDFVVELANEHYKALLQGREVVGRPFAEVMPELGLEAWNVLNRVLDTGVPFIANEWPVPYDFDGDGVIEDHWFNVVYNPRRESDGSVSGLIAVLTDVTQHVLARKELERVNRELEEFAYVASHDLQEPLRMVNIYSQLLVRRFAAGEGEANKYGALITQGVDRMGRLIGDLLSYSRSVQRDESPVGTADLSAALEDALGVLKTRIDDTGAVIDAIPLPKVKAEEAQISHVFQNILANGLKYSKPGAIPQITIRAEMNDQCCVVSVRDNGIGFEQQYAKKIFGLFKRLHSSGYPGTGVGLAICQRIIERYGGAVWAESELGSGATFYFSLPMAGAE